MRKYEFLSFLFIFIISVFVVFELFISIGRPTTFDGPTHITDIAGYSQALASGNFPVFWLDKFGNYGMPIGLFSHQLPLTLAGAVNIFVHDPILIYTLFLFLGIFLTNVTFYLFLRIYFSSLPALGGITLLTFSSYRIIDIYVRGDMPEIFAGIFLGLILLGLYYLIKQQKLWGFFLIAVSYCFLTLTHPMMLLVYAFLVFPYALYLFLTTDRGQIESIKAIFNKSRVTLVSLFCIAVILGLGMAAYFALPLNIEVKYLYFGQEKSHLSPQFLSWLNFFSPQWFYFYKNDVVTRGQFIQSGLIESMIVLIGLVLFLGKIIKDRVHLKISLSDIAVVCSILVLFFTTTLSLPLYQHILFLSDLQMPWRMLAIYIFLPPIVISSLLQKVNKDIAVLGFVFLVLILRFPQIYGKNYVDYSPQSYSFTKYNLFPIDMNTIWTGPTETYPIEKTKIGIISGTGTIVSVKVSNNVRNYVVEGTTPLRLADYTFYFPGWHVYVDGVSTPIQFQDPNYRGVITYMVPPGRHTIRVVLQDTAVRRFAKLLSLLFTLLFGVIFVMRRKLANYAKLYV